MILAAASSRLPTYSSPCASSLACIGGGALGVSICNDTGLLTWGGATGRGCLHLFDLPAQHVRFGLVRLTLALHDLRVGLAKLQ